MAFWGCKFTFDGVSCDEHELMIYNVGNDQQGETEFAHTVTIQEERVGKHWKPLFFGVTYEKKLEAEVVFGVNQDRIDRQEHLTRQEMAAISSWLAGHDQYKWLEVDQEDLKGIRYRCMVTSLKVIDHESVPWAFSATFTCDGPYAYLYPEEYTYEVDGELIVELDNKSDHNGYYSPIISYTPTLTVLTDEIPNALTDEQANVLTTGGGAGSEFIIENQTDGRTMQFSRLPATLEDVVIDNNLGVITSNSLDNMYEYFNFRFLRLKRGLNTLKLSCHGIVTFRCEFPVSVGM